ncbi:SPOR domain-containing protein [candidate division KSB1 bacterium]|nr:SPOR domain-containing protein [candidate division KSB1 bacterium]
MTTTKIIAQQSDIDKLEKYYFEDRLDILDSLLMKAEQTSPDHPTVLYFRGLFEKQASVALARFENVYNNHKYSDFADDALFRIAQYYYSVSDFINTRKYLSFFFKEFNNSDLKDRAQYLFCQTIYAQGKEDSAKIFLQAFIKNVRNSPFVDLAVIDLESPDMWSRSYLTEEMKSEPVPDSNFRYSIQIGAFTVKRNAIRVKEKFEEDSHYVEIREKKIDNRIFYAVWIGRFETREQAQDYAIKYIQKYNIDYKLVNR